MKKAGIIVAIIAMFTISCLVNMKPLVENENVQYTIALVNKIANAQTEWLEPGPMLLFANTCSSCDLPNGQTGIVLGCKIAWSVCSSYGTCGYGYC